jgi:hypothetical protein
MLNTHYLSDCRQILQAFELSQAQMLRSQVPHVQKEFEIEIEQMEKLFSDMHNFLNALNKIPHEKRFLLIKQLERLLKFIKELRGQVTRFSKPDILTEKDILFIFERQYKFKVIFRNHLTDFTRIV